MTTTMKMSWLRESSVLWSEDWLRGAEGRRGGEGGKKDKEMGGGGEGGVKVVKKMSREEKRGERGKRQKTTLLLAETPTTKTRNRFLASKASTFNYSIVLRIT